MDPELVFSNCRIVTRHAVVDGSLCVADGRITALDTGPSHGRAVIDLEGDYLLPGLIEMHTDNLEKHLVPRPGVLWPAPPAALLAHDTLIVNAGITTVFDALFIGDFLDKGTRRSLLQSSIKALGRLRELNLLRADHLLHLRCEVSDPGALEIFSQHVDHPRVGLVSLMDHTPGQRQWTNLDKYRLYHRDKRWTDDEFHQVVASRRANQRQFASATRRAVLDLARQQGIPLASHDDTTIDHVDQGHHDGVAICEFPTTATAAKRAHALGLTVVMGAPNLVRGNSHSGNVSARELAQQQVLDGLSSDYYPASLLHSIFILSREQDVALTEAVAKVSANVAAAVGLTDRGQIAVGLNADLIRVGFCDQIPVVKSVWRAGRQVL